MKTRKQRKPLKEKTIDAVNMMREIRDKITKDILNMTYEEEKAYIKKLLAKG